MHCIEEYGVIAFYGRFISDFIKLQDITYESNWHTGITETDPWVWKDKSANEKKAVFGCILNGYKGFISQKMFPYFCIAYRPKESPEELYNDGLISYEAYKLYNLLDENKEMNTSEIRISMGVTKKNGGSKVDRAIVELQKKFFISVTGSERKINKFGEPYGWSVITYSLTDEYYNDWLKNFDIDISCDEAKEYILELCCKRNPNASVKEIKKILFGKK